MAFLLHVWFVFGIVDSMIAEKTRDNKPAKLFKGTFVRLAKMRLQEAEVLLAQECYSGAYYLCGYAVECAFKACIAAKTQQYEFPPVRRTIDSYYQHDPSKLLDASGLEKKLDQAAQLDRALTSNWSIVAKWSEQSRYKEYNILDLSKTRPSPD